MSVRSWKYSIMLNNLNTYLKKSRIILLLRNSNSRFNEFYLLSFTNRFLIKTQETFKRVFKNSFLGRLSETKEDSEVNALSGSITVKLLKKPTGLILDQFSKIFKGSKFRKMIEKTQYEFKNITLKQVGSIITIAIITNTIFEIFFNENDISYFNLIIKAGLFLCGIFLVLSNSDFHSIIINSYFYKRLIK